MDSLHTNILPLGSLLLNRDSPALNERLKILNQVQEIVDDFVLEDKLQVQVDSRIVILYALEKDTIPQEVQEFATLAQESFEVVLLDISLLENFSGQLGGLSAVCTNGEIVTFSQAVLFVNEESLLRFKGVYSVADFQNPKALLQTLQDNLGDYHFKEMIAYREDYCQYHHRRERYCAKCAEVCPTFGITENGHLMELVFSHVDCVHCGACVGVCPTNCLEYEELPKEAFNEILEFYQHTRVFLCSLQDYIALSSQEFILPENILPLILPNLLMLNENDLLSIIQTSGNALFVFGESLSAPMQFINHITQQIYKKDAIILINKESLGHLASLATSSLELEVYLYKNRTHKPFRESFAQRLQFMIKERDYGLARSIVQEGENPVFYGNINVDSDKCTLCLSCVGACNVNALFARSDDFSLRFNASLCTTCGYCVTSCPENVIELHRDGLELNAQYFKSREIAKDAPFLCVECGEAFSTKKSIEKVVSMLGASFQSDPRKLRTLQCCPNCKVKVMFGASGVQNV